MDEATVRDEDMLLPRYYGETMGQEFVQRYSARDWGITEDDERILIQGPTHPCYAKTWERVLKSARFYRNGAKLVIEKGNLYYGNGGE